MNPNNQCVCVLHTGRAGDVDDASLGLSHQRQEGLGDVQRPEEVYLHAASEVGHQRQLCVSKVDTHSGIVDQTPQTCTHTHTQTEG